MLKQAKEENASARKRGSQKNRTVESAKGGTAVATGQGQSDFRAQGRCHQRERPWGGSACLSYWKSLEVNSH